MLITIGKIKIKIINNIFEPTNLLSLFLSLTF